ncbi:helix-turn-helix domain-containing protein [Tistrella bauzanensis]
MSQNDTPDDMPMPAATAATGATGSVQAVTRALDLLRILAETPGGIGLSPAARKAGLAASTAHRLLNTLAARGWASFDALTICGGWGLKPSSPGRPSTRRGIWRQQRCR